MDFGAGLAAMGKSLMQTTSMMATESVRAGFEKDKMTLADQLASVREEKGRAFATGERVASQAYQSGEKALDRTHAEKLASEARATTLAAAGISAGPGYARVALDREQFNAEAPLRAEKLESQRAQTEATRTQTEATRTEMPLRTEQLKAQTEASKAQTKIYTQEELAKTIKNQNDQEEKAAIKAYTEVKNDKNATPDMVKEAEQRLAAATWSRSAAVQEVTTAAAVAAQFRSLADSKRLELTTLNGVDQIEKMSPEHKARVAQVTKELNVLQAQHAQAVRDQQKAQKNLPSLLGDDKSGASPPIDLNKYLKSITPPAASKPAPVTGKPQQFPLMQSP